MHDRLRSDILLARLPPGELLSENQQAQRLGVSRTPVREAIQRLVREGWVQVWPQRGSVVALMSLQRIRDALFVREAVECLIAEGHRRIGLVEGPEGFRSAYERHQGWREALEAQGLPCDASLIARGST